MFKQNSQRPSYYQLTLRSKLKSKKNIMATINIFHMYVRSRSESIPICSVQTINAFITTSLKFENSRHFFLSNFTCRSTFGLAGYQISSRSLNRIKATGKVRQYEIHFWCKRNLALVRSTYFNI